MKKCDVCGSVVDEQDGYTDMWTEGRRSRFCPVCFVEHVGTAFSLVGPGLKHADLLDEIVRQQLGDEAYAEMQAKAKEAGERMYERYKEANPDCTCDTCSCSDNKKDVKFVIMGRCGNA